MTSEHTKQRARERADRIRKAVPIVELLSKYGYAVREEFEDREQQFSCDLHGDGMDNKPSARVYPNSASWYCFACGITRDAIRTVQDKERLSFGQACFKLETDYNLPHFVMGPDPEAPSQVSPGDAVAVDSTTSYEEEKGSTERLLMTLTKERTLSMEACLPLWEAFDTVVWNVEKGDWAEKKGKKMLALLRNKAIEVATKRLKAQR